MFPNKWTSAMSEWVRPHTTGDAPWVHETAQGFNQRSQRKSITSKVWLICQKEMLHFFLLVVAYHNGYLIISQEKKMTFSSGLVSSMELLSWCVYLNLCIYKIFLVIYVSHVSTSQGLAELLCKHKYDFQAPHKLSFSEVTQDGAPERCLILDKATHP